MARARRGGEVGFRRHQRIDPRREVVLHHVTDGPARGWLHTHGLAAHGMPELELRDVPLFLGRAGAGLLNELAAYLLNDAPKPFAAGDLIQSGASRILLVEGRPNARGGYDDGHYRELRLVLIDPPDDGCACDECAKELARRRSLHS
jgi:hypothetical protein